MKMRQISVRIRKYDIITSDNKTDKSNNKKSYMSEDIWSASIRELKTKISTHVGGVQTTKYKDTTLTCDQDMEERSEEAKTKKRRYRNTNMQAIKYINRETLSRRETETERTGKRAASA